MENFILVKKNRGGQWSKIGKIVAFSVITYPLTPLMAHPYGGDEFDIAGAGWKLKRVQGHFHAAMIDAQNFRRKFRLGSAAETNMCWLQNTERIDSKKEFFFTIFKGALIIPFEKVFVLKKNEKSLPVTNKRFPQLVHRPSGRFKTLQTKARKCLARKKNTTL